VKNTKSFSNHLMILRTKITLQVHQLIKRRITSKTEGIIKDRKVLNRIRIRTLTTTITITLTQKINKTSKRGKSLGSKINSKTKRDY